MYPFTYRRATALEETWNRKMGPHAKLIAGGTNLLDLMKLDIERPSELVDISRLPLSEISVDDEGLHIGAMASNSQVAYNAQVKEHYPLLSHAILAGASPQLRNMATVGGNLMQRTRCWYFYDTTTPCNKRDPGAGCSALHGINRQHAILGDSEHCIAVHPSDMCVGLAALEAVVEVSGPAGGRDIPFDQFHRLPENTPQLDTTLKHDEIITGIRLPPQGFAKHFSYVKVRERSSFAFALVAVAAGLEFDGERIAVARLALGGVAHKPWRDPQAEQILVGSPGNPESFQKTADFILRDARGQGHNDFKIVLARRAIVQALTQAAEGHR